MVKVSVGKLSFIGENSDDGGNSRVINWTSEQTALESFHYILTCTDSVGTEVDSFDVTYGELLNQVFTLNVGQYNFELDAYNPDWKSKNDLNPSIDCFGNKMDRIQFTDTIEVSLARDISLEFNLKEKEKTWGILNIEFTPSVQEDEKTVVSAEFEIYTESNYFGEKSNVSGGDNYTSVVVTNENEYKGAVTLPLGENYIIEGAVVYTTDIDSSESSSVTRVPFPKPYTVSLRPGEEKTVRFVDPNYILNDDSYEENILYATVKTAMAGADGSESNPINLLDLLILLKDRTDWSEKTIVYLDEGIPNIFEGQIGEIIKLMPNEIRICKDVESLDEENNDENVINHEVIFIIRNGKVEIDFDQLIEVANDGDEIVLAGNFTVDSRIEIKKNLTIKAAEGKQLSFNKSNSLNGQMFLFEIESIDGITVTFENVTFNGNNITPASGYVQGGIISMNSGEVILKNCVIKNSLVTNTNGGGAIFVDIDRIKKTSGKLTLENTEIYNCSAPKGNGGAIYCAGDTVDGELLGGELIVNGGRIYNNFAKEYGSDVYVAPQAKFTLTDGEVGAVYGTVEINKTEENQNTVEVTCVVSDLSKEMAKVAEMGNRFETNPAYVKILDTNPNLTALNAAIYDYTNLGSSGHFVCVDLDMRLCTGMTTFTGTETEETQTAFEDLTNLAGISLPSTVIEIGAYAFKYCSALKRISMPKGITSVGDYAFEYCIKLDSLDLPNVTSVGDSAFANSGVTTVTFSNKLESLGECAFDNATKLESMVIPEQVEELKYAFRNTKALDTIIINSTTMNFAANAFYGSSVKTIVFKGTNLNFSGRDDVFAGCSDVKILAGRGAVVDTSTLTDNGSGVITVYACTDTPETAGDIALLDGTFVSTDGYFALKDYFDVSTPAGVVGYINENKDNGYIIALEETTYPKYAWARSTAPAFNTSVSANIAAWNSGDSDGSDNWAEICFVDDMTSANLQDYPAFNYALEYGKQEKFKGTVFAKDWYVPTIGEVSSAIRDNKVAINKALETLGCAQISGELLTSNQNGSESAVSSAMTFNIGSATVVSGTDGSTGSRSKSEDVTVCVIRKYPSTEYVTTLIQLQNALSCAKDGDTIFIGDTIELNRSATLYAPANSTVTIKAADSVTFPVYGEDNRLTMFKNIGTEGGEAKIKFGNRNDNTSRLVFDGETSDKNSNVNVFAIFDEIQFYNCEFKNSNKNSAIYIDDRCTLDLTKCYFHDCLMGAIYSDRTEWLEKDTAGVVGIHNTVIENSWSPGTLSVRFIPLLETPQSGDKPQSIYLTDYSDIEQKTNISSEGNIISITFERPADNANILYVNESVSVDYIANVWDITWYDVGNSVNFGQAFPTKDELTPNTLANPNGGTYILENSEFEYIEYTY